MSRNNGPASHADLLKMALAAQQDTNGANTAAPAAPTPSADYEWLRGMLSELESTESKVDRLTHTLTRASDTAEIVALLETLQECAEDLDIAVRVAANGCARLAALVEHDDADVRFWATYLVATCALNNPRASLSLLEAGALARVLKRIPLEPEEAVRGKLVTALSSITNDLPLARERFFDSHGVALLHELLTRVTSDVSRAKLLFFAQKLVRLAPDRAIDEFAGVAFVESAVEALAAADMTVRTNAAKLLGGLLARPTAPLLTHLDNFHFAQVVRSRRATLRASTEDVEQHEDELASMVRALDAYDAALATTPIGMIGASAPVGMIAAPAPVGMISAPPAPLMLH